VRTGTGDSGRSAQVSRRQKLSALLLNLPLLIEKAGRCYRAGKSGGNGRIDIDNGIIRQLGNLPGIVEVIVFPIGKATV